MVATDWLKQTNKPLFQNILWERPVSKRTAKKLLILGGHKSQFGQTQAAYQSAVAAGVGEAKVVLPQAVRNLIGEHPDCIFVADTKSGSLAKRALADIQRNAKESDGILIVGELSHNAETIGLIEQLLGSIKKPIAVTDEVIHQMLYKPQVLFVHAKRLLIASTQTFVELANRLGMAIEIKPAASLPNQIALLKQLAEANAAAYVLGDPQTIVHVDSNTSVTDASDAKAVTAPSLFATFWLQHANKFEALTTAAFVLSELSDKSSQDIAARDFQIIIDKYSQS